MSLPGDTYSSIAIPGLYLPPDDMVSSPLHDYEMGGVAIEDGSQGLMVQPWECWANVFGEVYCRPLGAEEATQLFVAIGITELSFTFDLNMFLTVAYVQDNTVKLRWWDTLANAYVTTVFPGARSPKVAHDDKRRNAGPRSDVILGYLHGDKLCYRQQRDRYTVERVLRTAVSPSMRLGNVGMADNFRLQFELV